MNATALADLSADDLTALLDEQRAAYERGGSIEDVVADLVGRTEAAWEGS